MLSMVLAQHTGFILTWTQWQQSLPPVDLLWTVTQPPGTVSITSWNGKGCYTHKAARAAAEGVWWAALCETLPLPEPRVPAVSTLQFCTASAAFLLNHEFFTLFTYCASLQMNSESLASAWNWAFCEVQSAVDRNCFRLWKKPAHIANSHDWDGSSCQADLTAFALTYIMHYLINNHSGLGPKLGYWYCVKLL